MAQLIHAETRHGVLGTIVLVVVLTLAVAAAGQRGPAPGGDELVTDPIVELQRKLNSGELVLKWDEEHGYLPALLKALNVPVSSQSLVFSKTSFQTRRISPRTPRAIYFGDDVYVGWVQRGDVLEISSVDAKEGAVFYSLKQRPTKRPKFELGEGSCLQCHESSHTKNVPGHLIRSVYSDLDGFALLGNGSFRTTHESPFNERWGGWYVTGTHGDMRHMGNVTAKIKLREFEDEVALDIEAGANVTDLSKYFDTDKYLTPHSDLIALMVLEHQAMMHNLLSKASFSSRHALSDQKELNELDGLPAGHLRRSTKLRMSSAAEPLIEYMLFSNEAKLQSPIVGNVELCQGV